MRWRILALSLVVSLSSLWFVWGQGEKRVTIELKDAPIADAFDQLFRAAGENFVLQPGPPMQQKLTMRLVDVPFEKALNFLCDLAGLKWERKEGVYFITPKMPPVGVSITAGAPPMVFGPMTGGAIVSGSPPVAVVGMGIAPPMTLPGTIPFNICTRCRQVVIRPCPECKRPMDFHWNFCPFDGTKLPPAPQNCPKCGAPLPKLPAPPKLPKLEGEERNQPKR